MHRILPFLSILCLILTVQINCSSGESEEEKEVEQALSEQMNFLIFPQKTIEFTGFPVILEHKNDPQALLPIAQKLISEKKYTDALTVLTAQMCIYSNDAKLKDTLKLVLDELYARTNNTQDKLNILYRILSLDYEDLAVKNSIESLVHVLNPASRFRGYGDALKAYNEAFNAWDREDYEVAKENFELASKEAEGDFNMKRTRGLFLQCIGKAGDGLKLLMELPETERTVIEEKAMAQINWAKDYLAKHEAPTQTSSVNETILYNGAKIYLGDQTGIEALQSLLDTNAVIDSLDKRLVFHLITLGYCRAGKYLLALPYFEKYKKEIYAAYPHKDHLQILLYKVQLEDNRSIDVIAQKFRTDANWIRAINFLDDPNMVRDYQVLMIPRVRGGRPYMTPTYGIINSCYGLRLDPFRAAWQMHSGMDIKTNELIPSVAVGDGTVIHSGFSNSAGNMVILDHGRGMRSKYLHGAENLVKYGDEVVQGQQIMINGNTGRSVATHLHFEVGLLDKSLDPIDFF